MQMKKQLDINDCGLVVLQALHKHIHGQWININELKSRAFISDKGISISNLTALAKKYGVKLEALEGNIQDLYSSNTNDFLVTLIKSEDSYHYVVIKIKDKYVQILDPVKGKYKITKKEFSEYYQNVIITFKEIPYEKTNIENITGMIFKDPVIIFTLIVSILISIVITFSSSIYMKIIIDKIIPRYLNKELIVISLIFIWLSLMKAFNLIIKKYFSRKLTLSVNYNLTSIYINKICNADLNELNKITKSDHLRRIAMIDSVSDFIASIMFIAFGDLIMLCSSIAILFWISTRLFVVVFITAAISIAISTVFNLFVKEEYSNTLNYQKKYLTSNITIINSYEKLKEINFKNYAKEKFRKNYIDYKYSQSKIYWLKSASSAWDIIVNMVSPIIITFIGTKIVFNNQISIGSMIMFVSLFRTFLGPLDSIATTMLTVPLELKHLNLIKYILMLENEKLNKKGYIPAKIKSISFQDIAFGFEKTIIKIKKLIIKNNLKIKGPNGIGKTSFMKLLSCRYKTNGKHFINNIEVPFINKENIRNRIYYSNNEYIPDITIYEYITLLDPYKAQIFSDNVIKYNLNKLFKKIELDLSKTLLHNGSNVSGGQLQIIKLLRLFTCQYDLILLDEATDNITQDVLNIITKAITSYQKGIFIEVSHNNKYISQGKEVSFEKIIER